MKNNKTAHAQTPQELLTDLRTLVSDAEKMVGDSISEHTADAVSALRSRYEAASERLGDMYEVTRKRVVAGAKATDETIRENPYQSLAIAAGVALVVGILLGRSSNK
jgi:ElaB protein